MTQVPASKPERPRLREPRDDREPVMVGGMARELGQLFTHLLGDTDESAGDPAEGRLDGGDLVVDELGQQRATDGSGDESSGVGEELQG